MTKSLKPTMNWRSPVGIHIIVMSCIFAYLSAFSGASFLPEKYLRDARTIRMFIDSTPVALSESPFGRTADLYRHLSFLGGQEAMGLIAITLFSILSYKCLPKGAPVLWHAVILAAGFVLAGMYLAVYSKDFFVVPLVLLFVYLRPTWKWEVLWIGVVLWYASILRANWLVVAAVYVAMRLILKISKSLSAAWAWTVALLLLMAIVFYVFLGESLHFHRYDVTENIGMDINTKIVDPIEIPGVLGSFLNGVYSFVVFLFPVELALMGSPIYILAAVFIGVAWYLLFRKLRVVLKSDHAEQSVLFWRVTALLLSYTLVQSLYAPDWGAYLRHITPLIPLFAVVLGTTTGTPVIRKARKKKVRPAPLKHNQPSRLTQDYLKGKI